MAWWGWVLAGWFAGAVLLAVVFCVCSSVAKRQGWTLTGLRNWPPDDASPFELPESLPAPRSVPTAERGPASRRKVSWAHRGGPRH